MRKEVTIVIQSKLRNMKYRMDAIVGSLPLYHCLKRAIIILSIMWDTNIHFSPTKNYNIR